MCLSSDWTGALVFLLRFYRCTTKVLIVLVCLSADWAGALVFFILSHPASLAFCLLSDSFFVFCFRVVCWSLCLLACSFYRSALSVLVCRVLFGSCAPVVWPFGRCCFFPSSVALCVFACVFWLLRIGSFSPDASPLVLPTPFVVQKSFKFRWQVLPLPCCPCTSVRISTHSPDLRNHLGTHRAKVVR